MSPAIVQLVVDLNTPIVVRGPLEVESALPPNTGLELLHYDRMVDIPLLGNNAVPRCQEEDTVGAHGVGEVSAEDVPDPVAALASDEQDLAISLARN